MCKRDRPAGEDMVSKITPLAREEFDFLVRDWVTDYRDIFDLGGTGDTSVLMTVCVEWACKYHIGCAPRLAENTADSIAAAIRTTSEPGDKPC